MRNFCSIEKSQLVPESLVYRVQINEVVYLSSIPSIGEIGW